MSSTIWISVISLLIAILYVIMFVMMIIGGKVQIAFSQVLSPALVLLQVAFFLLIAIWIRNRPAK